MRRHRVVGVAVTGIMERVRAVGVGQHHVYADLDGVGQPPVLAGTNRREAVEDRIDIVLDPESVALERDHHCAGGRGLADRSRLEPGVCRHPDALRDAGYGCLADQTVVNDLVPLEQPYGHLKVFDLKTYDLIDDAVYNKDGFDQTYYFTDVTHPCWTGSFTLTSPCAKPDTYLFWDLVHPTKKAHALTADFAYNTLYPPALMANFAIDPPTAVPEASTWAMMLIGFAGLGFAGYRASRENAAGAA